MDKLIEYGENKQETILTRDDITSPEGWFWEDDWTVDHNRPVDGDGKKSGLLKNFLSYYSMNTQDGSIQCNLR